MQLQSDYRSHRGVTTSNYQITQGCHHIQLSDHTGVSTVPNYYRSHRGVTISNYQIRQGCHPTQLSDYTGVSPHPTIRSHRGVITPNYYRSHKGCPILRPRGIPQTSTSVLKFVTDSGSHILQWVDTPTCVTHHPPYLSSSPSQLFQKIYS